MILNISKKDGPAVEHPDGSKFWYLDDKHFKEKEFLNQIKI
jgi:hypothetical protein